MKPLTKKSRQTKTKLSTLFLAGFMLCSMQSCSQKSETKSEKVTKVDYSIKSNFIDPETLKGDQKKIFWHFVILTHKQAKVLKPLKVKEEFEKLGVKPGDLGSHSTRKGSITLVSSGCTVSPPMSSICLRACWSMGNVKDRYIHYEKAGDQFCGRSATGISSLRKEFAVSPVYFELGNAPPEIEIEIN